MQCQCVHPDPEASLTGPNTTAPAYHIKTTAPHQPGQLQPQAKEALNLTHPSNDGCRVRVGPVRTRRAEEVFGGPAAQHDARRRLAATQGLREAVALRVNVSPPPFRE